MSKGWLLMKPLQGGATPSLPPTSYCHCPSYHKGRPAPRWCTVHTSYNEHKHHSAKCKVLKYSSAAFQAALLSCHLTLHQGSSLVGLYPIEQHLVSLSAIENYCSCNSLLCSHQSAPQLCYIATLHSTLTLEVGTRVTYGCAVLRCALL